MIADMRIYMTHKLKISVQCPEPIQGAPATTMSANNQTSTGFK